MEGKWILCRNCIDAIKSRGEKIYVGDEIDVDCWEEDNNVKAKCEWCDEEDTPLYECIQ